MKIQCTVLQHSTRSELINLDLGFMTHLCDSLTNAETPSPAFLVSFIPMSFFAKNGKALEEELRKTERHHKHKTFDWPCLFATTHDLSARNNGSMTAHLFCALSSKRVVIDDDSGTKVCNKGSAQNHRSSQCKKIRSKVFARTSHPNHIWFWIISELVNFISHAIKKAAAFSAVHKQIVSKTCMRGIKWAQHVL